MDLESLQKEGDIRIKKHRPTYYYRNNHGKVVSLSEDVALEQHRIHPKYYGSSDDLQRTGFDISEAMAKHLEENVQNPQSPPDKRKVTNYSPGRVGSGVDVSQIREQVKQEILTELKNEALKQKTEDKGNNGDTGKTPKGCVT